MKTRVVIDLASWAAGLSSMLVAAGLFAAGLASSLLNTSGLAAGSMTLGALLSRLPGRAPPSVDTHS